MRATMRTCNLHRGLVEDRIIVCLWQAAMDRLVEARYMTLSFNEIGIGASWLGALSSWNLQHMWTVEKHDSSCKGHVLSILSYLTFQILWAKMILFHFTLLEYAKINSWSCRNTTIFVQIHSQSSFSAASCWFHQQWLICPSSLEEPNRTWGTRSNKFGLGQRHSIKTIAFLDFWQTCTKKWTNGSQKSCRPDIRTAAKITLIISMAISMVLDLNQEWFAKSDTGQICEIRFKGVCCCTKQEGGRHTSSQIQERQIQKSLNSDGSIFIVRAILKCIMHKATGQSIAIDQMFARSINKQLADWLNEENDTNEWTMRKWRSEWMNGWGSEWMHERTNEQLNEWKR